MDRLKENEIYDKFQDLCNSHKEISHFGDKHICNTECPLRDTNRCENVFFYQQGKADAVKEVIPLLRAIKFVLDDYATRLSDYSKVIDEHLKGAENE